MKHNANIGLSDLVEGFLFSLRAEGKSNGTIEYYTYLLHPLLSYAGGQGWPDSIASLDSHKLRGFLIWTATRSYELKVANNGGRVVKKAKPSTACANNDADHSLLASLWQVGGQAGSMLISL